jgi:hypothetical protein
VSGEYVISQNHGEKVEESETEGGEGSD